ncbi:MAG: glycosyltransferase family 4 protein [Oscillospiraceae bacterium]|nr:glycosyltransferase family 4 protein [Oscillospiraceae bacterium]
MKILIVTTIYKIDGHPELFHDTEAVHYLVKPLVDFGHQVKVIFIYRQNILKKLTAQIRYKGDEVSSNEYFYNCDGVDVALCKVILYLKSLWNIGSGTSKKVANFIDRYLKESDFTPDVCVSHVPSATVDIWKYLKLDVPMIGVLHESDVQIMSKHRNVVGMMESTYSSLYARSSSIRDRARNFTSVKDEIVYSGVDIPEKTRMSRNDDKLVILYVGKLIKRKRLDYLIRALSKVSSSVNFKLEIYGEGDFEESLKELCNSCLNDDQYTFYGTRPRNEIFDAMYQADVFCMTSVNETLGLVYLEAMACGCIVVGSRGEGIDGIVKDGVNGILVSPDSIDEISNAILKIANMSLEERERYVSAAKETMSYYTEEKASEHYMSLIENNIDPELLARLS